MNEKPVWSSGFSLYVSFGRAKEPVLMIKPAFETCILYCRKTKQI